MLASGASSIIAAGATFFLGQPQPAIDCFRKFERLGRFSPFTAAADGGLAIACVQAGRDEAAIVAAKRAIAKAPLYPAPYKALAAACAHLGRMEEEADAIAKDLDLVPDDTVSDTRARSGYVDNEATRRYFDGLRLAGLPE